jgi:hypothetical protein
VLLSKTDGILSTLCMNVASQTISAAVTLVTCGATDIASPTQAWIPAPSVGAGAAAPPQWINYYEFGRCLDVYQQNVNTTHLIDYPCKQNPYTPAVAWNQKFTTPTIAPGGSRATGQIYTTTSLTNYCLTSPGTDGGYVTVKPCGTAGAIQSWTIYNDDNSLPYATKFTIVDGTGRCLSLGAPLGSEQWSAVDVEQCVGGGEQKWNAAPTTPSLLNTSEK